MKKLIILLVLCIPIIGYSQTDEDALYSKNRTDLEVLYQHNPDYRDTYDDIFNACEYHQINTAAFVEFERSVSLYLNVHKINDSEIKLHSFGKGKVEGRGKVQRVERGHLVIDELAKNQSYALVSENSCREEVPFYVFDTFEGINRLHEGVIQVSEKMFHLATEFGRQDPNRVLDLCEYLNEKGKDIHLYERLAFYQQKIYRGKVLPTDIIETHDPRGPIVCPDPDPDDPTTDPDDEPVKCICDFLSLNQNISQGGYVPTPWDGTYTAHVTEGREDLGSNARKWWTKGVKGAAKYQMYFSEGFKNNPCNQQVGGTYNLDEESEEEAGDVTSPFEFQNISRISLNLICNDQNALPAECDCGKRVNFDYQYDTRVSAFAEILGSWTQWCSGQRRATAAAQDMAVVYCEVRSDEKGTGQDSLKMLQIIDAINVGTAASCETVIDTSFFENWLDFAEVILDDSQISISNESDDPIITTMPSDSLSQDSTVVAVDSTQISNSSGGINVDISLSSNFAIIDALEALIEAATTNVFFASDCDNHAIRERTMTGHFSTVIQPNDQIYFYMRSHASTGAMGRRSWYAEAFTTSDYAMTVVVSPGLTSGAEADCCTPWGAIYSGGAFAEPLHSGELWQLMGSFLASFNMVDCLWGTSPAVSRGDFGVCTRPANTNPNCPVPVVGGLAVPDDNDVSDALSKETDMVFERPVAYTYTLFDMNGRALYLKGNAEMTMDVLINQLQYSSDLVSGLYVLQQRDENSGEVVVKKIVIP